MGAVIFSQSEIRQKCRRNLDQISNSEKIDIVVAIWTQTILRRLLQDYHEFALFAPLGFELPLRPVFEKLLLSEKPCYFPRTQGEQLEFYRVRSWGELAAHGPCWEPNGSTEKLEDHSRLAVFCPGIAFSPLGSRIGSGRGFYDRWLARHPLALRLSLIASPQMRFEAWPEKPSDERVDWIVSPQAAWKPERGRARTF
ncbi:MAG: 5-formyltetrahydrofolate cyclo-ligase [Bradymonadales bacterium]|nr:MAG: 5-formyltetrahydrofolate cyclo-ligase [Bradymonadales bacterium]